MKKSIVLLLALILIPTIMRAETPNVQPLEGGLSIGYAAPLASFHGGNSKGGATFEGELRYNFPESKFDAGMFLQFDAVMREYPKDTQTNRALLYGLSSHYNFRQGKKVNPFVGIGLACSFNDAVNEVYYESNRYGFAINPRFGVELWHHLRITAGFQFTRKSSHSFNLAVGFVIGGRPRK